jgi:hypothetical protein
MNISDDDFLVFFYLQKYSFLTIEQARFALGRRRSYQSMARRLKSLEDQSLLASFGGHRIGYANTPKIFFLTRPGFELLENESGIPAEMLGRFRKKTKPKWTTKTKHRIFLIDLFLSLEQSVRRSGHLELDRVFLEYRFVKKGGRIFSETTDFVADEPEPENKIVPDGAFVLKSLRTSAEGLFFIEMDMATEQIVSRITKNADFAIKTKFEKYDRYLSGGRYRDKYGSVGNFDYFTMLFVTLSDARINNIRRKLSDLSPEFHEYYFFNTHEAVMDDFFNQSWKSRDHQDPKGHSPI